jgi:hypothetical protein
LLARLDSGNLDQMRDSLRLPPHKLKVTAPLRFSARPTSYAKRPATRHSHHYLVATRTTNEETTRRLRRRTRCSRSGTRARNDTRSGRCLRAFNLIAGRTRLPKRGSIVPTRRTSRNLTSAVSRPSRRPSTRHGTLVNGSHHDAAERPAANASMKYAVSSSGRRSPLPQQLPSPRGASSRGVAPSRGVAQPTDGVLPRSFRHRTQGLRRRAETPGRV